MKYQLILKGKCLFLNEYPSVKAVFLLLLYFLLPIRPCQNFDLPAHHLSFKRSLRHVFEKLGFLAPGHAIHTNTLTHLHAHTRARARVHIHNRQQRTLARKKIYVQ
jgi:hypothetical protein